MDGRTEADDIRKHAEMWRQTLHNRLLDAVKQVGLLSCRWKETAIVIEMLSLVFVLAEIWLNSTVAVR